MVLVQDRRPGPPQCGHRPPTRSREEGPGIVREGHAGGASRGRFSGWVMATSVGSVCSFGGLWLLLDGRKSSDDLNDLEDQISCISGNLGLCMGISLGISGSLAMVSPCARLLKLCDSLRFSPNLRREIQLSLRKPLMGLKPSRTTLF